MLWLVLSNILDTSKKAANTRVPLFTQHDTVRAKIYNMG